VGIDDEASLTFLRSYVCGAFIDKKDAAGLFCKCFASSIVAFDQNILFVFAGMVIDVL
jgi:hypothetical protein